MNKLISIVGFGALLAVGSAFASTILTQTPQGSYANNILNGSQWTEMTGYLTAQHTITSTADFSNLSQLNAYDVIWVDQELGGILSGAEISALTSYASAGGKLVLVGENNSWDAWNASILSIVGGGHLSGCFSDVGTAISGHMLASGVGSIQNVCGSKLTSAGSPDMLFSNNLAGAYGVGAGEALVFLDANWNDNNNIIDDHAVFAQNIADWIGDSASATTYSVGGTVSGLTGTGLALQNNGGDTFAVAAAATAFTFATELVDTTAYAVTVSTQPTGQTCSVTNGSGTIAAADVTNVAVTCVTDVVPTYSVGGTVSGLTGTGLALQNNGGDTFAAAAAATAFTFATELVDTTAYAVTVSTQPTGQTCSVTNGSGTIAAADVTNVAVTCEDDVVPPMPATPVPAASQWALIMLSMLIGLMVFANRRRLF